MSKFSVFLRALFDSTFQQLFDLDQLTAGLKHVLSSIDFYILRRALQYNIKKTTVKILQKEHYLVQFFVVSADLRLYDLNIIQYCIINHWTGFTKCQNIIYNSKPTISTF